MSRVHVDDTKPLLTQEEEEARDRYEQMIERGENVQVIHPDLIRRYRELWGAC